MQIRSLGYILAGKYPYVPELLELLSFKSRIEPVRLSYQKRKHLDHPRVPGKKDAIDMLQNRPKQTQKKPQARGIAALLWAVHR
jgi:hypothetical protein